MSVEEADTDGSIWMERPPNFPCAVTGGTLQSVHAPVGDIVEAPRKHIGEHVLGMRAVDPANIALDVLEVDAAPPRILRHRVRSHRGRPRPVRR